MRRRRSWPLDYVIALICTVVVLAGIPSQAQVKYSNEFMNIGVDASIMGTGGAGVASVYDAGAGYWNPAGLARMKSKWDAGLMHAEYFAGLAKYDYGAFAYQIDATSAAAVSVIRFGVDDIPNTLELIDEDGNVRYDRIRNFSAVDMAVMMSYGRQLPLEGLSIGGTVKVIHRRTGSFAQAWGFGLDAGAHYLFRQWHFALVTRDVSSTFNAWRFNTADLEEVFALTGNELPENSLELTLPRLILGASRTFVINDTFSGKANLDIHMTTDGKRPVLASLGFTGLDPYLGADINYKKWLSVRFGVGQFQWFTGLEGQRTLSLQPAIGLGITFKNVRINYALTDIGDLAIAQYSNIVSLHYGL